MAALITNVQKAKEFNDSFLTDLISKQQGNAEDNPKPKKIKPDS
jgi:hypothetical protein